MPTLGLILVDFFVEDIGIIALMEKYYVH